MPEFDVEGFAKENAEGLFTRGHEIMLHAHNSAPFVLPVKVGNKIVNKIYVYGYEITGTQIRIEPEVICGACQWTSDRPLWAKVKVLK